MSPTQRTLVRLRSLGYLAQVVERWQPYCKPKPGGPPGVRIDLFGCIDLVAVGHGELLGVQACSGSSHSSRREKALTQPGLRGWLDGGGQFEVWSWEKRGKNGKRKLWYVRVEPIVILDGRLLPAESRVFSPRDERAVDVSLPAADADDHPPDVEGSR